MQEALVRFSGVVAFAFLLFGCYGGTGGGEAPASDSASTEQVYCSTENQRSWLRAYMSDEYFWYSNMGTPNERAPDIESYFRSLLYTPVDRYSSSQPTSTFVQLQSEGTRTGYGYTLVWADAAQTVLRVRFAEPLSPVGVAGLNRGDTVLSIDGYGPQAIASGAIGAVSREGVPRTFLILSTEGVERSFTVVSATYPISTVPSARLLTLGTPEGTFKAGYFVYQAFLPGSASALRSVFTDFASAGVAELIVDLRYNGGGSVSMARNLASMIGGSGLNGRPFAEFRFNAKHPERAFSIAFTSNTTTLPAAPLTGLRRVFIITSPSTASASELVINSLEPYTSVVLIGGTTYGKPYASLPRDYCGTTYSAVNYEIVNALGAGGYNNGIAPNCTVGDDLDHQLGDASEARLEAAIHYIQTGSCPAGTDQQGGQFAGKPLQDETAIGETDPKLLILD
jgi:C-terminal processing protease CtpA/Prc